MKKKTKQRKKLTFSIKYFVLSSDRNEKANEL